MAHFLQENILCFDHVSITSFQKAEVISTTVRVRLWNLCTWLTTEIVLRFPLTPCTCARVHTHTPPTPPYVCAHRHTPPLSCRLGLFFFPPGYLVALVAVALSRACGWQEVWGCFESTFCCHSVYLLRDGEWGFLNDCFLDCRRTS